MAQDGCDYTLTMRSLSRFSSAAGANNEAVRDWFIDREKFSAWSARYVERLHAEASVDAERAERMDCVNPKFVLRNHLAETLAAGGLAVALIVQKMAMVDMALAGGEDYELAFTLPPDALATVEGRIAPLGCGLSVIGKVLSGSGVTVAVAGRRESPPAGFDHFG